jgi:hypothetical protein
MRMCRVSAVIVAAVIGGVGLTACGTSGSNPAAATSAPAANGSPTASASTPGGSPTSAMTSAPASSATPTHSHSAAADPTSASAHPKSSPHTSSPHTSSPASTSSGTHNFSVPAIAGEDVVTGYGSYTKLGTARVKVTMCAKQTGSAFSVGSEALAYSASGASQNIGATILTGPGNTTCVSTIFVLYTAHLKVHDFIGGSGGTIVKTGPVLTLY